MRVHCFELKTIIRLPVDCNSLLSYDAYILASHESGSYYTNGHTDIFLGTMGAYTVQRKPYSSVSCVDHEFLRKRLSYLTSSTIFFATRQPQTSLCWFHWLSKHRYGIKQS